MITENQVEKYLSHLFEITDADEIPATFFELTTLMALMHFAEESVDFVVLEVGLGGRLDATNVVMPELSVITSISLDHTEILGNSIEEITYEKSGIIKPNVPLVIGPKVPFNIIQPIAKQNNSPLFQVKNQSLLFDEENSCIAQAVLEQLSLKFPIPQEAIKKGLLDRPPCRIQKVIHSNSILPIFLDVGHNPDGLIHLFQAIRNEYPSQSISILFGLSKSKDILNCLKIIVSHGEVFFPVEATNGRGAPASTLEESLISMQINPGLIHRTKSVSQSLSLAMNHVTQNNQILVVCGSFFIMGAVRQALGILEPHDETDLNER